MPEYEVEIMMPKTIVHLLSGGMDSVVLLYDLHAQGHSLHCVLFDYKQQHVQELTWARHHCHRLNVLFTTVEIPQLVGSSLTDGKGGVVVPNRNAILLSLAVNLAVKASAETITYACNKDDDAVFPDCRRAFVQAFNELLLVSHIDIEVCAPYMDKAKWEIADLGRQIGVNFDETWSCYRGGAEPCHECAACKKREEAFSKSAYMTPLSHQFTRLNALRGGGKFT